MQYFNRKNREYSYSYPTGGTQLAYFSYFLNEFPTVKKFIEKYGYPLIMSGIKTASTLSNYKIWGNTAQDTITIEDENYKVPDDYILLDYIENAEETKINTGVAPSSAECEYYIKFYCNNLGSNYLFQSRIGSGNIYGISGSMTNATILGNTSGSTLTSGIKRAVGHIFEIRYTIADSVTTLYTKDLTTGEEDTKTGTLSKYTATTSPIYLFGNGGDQYIASGTKIYEAYYKEDGEYKLLLKPAEGAEVGMYDYVSNTLLTASTGSLTAGNIAPCPDQPITVRSVGLSSNLWEGTKYNGELYSDGAVLNVSGYKVTDYIGITAGNYYTAYMNIAETIEGNAVWFCFYDKNKTMVGDREGMYIPVGAYSVDVQAPTGAVYMRVSMGVDSSKVTKQLLVEGQYTAEQCESLELNYRIPVTLTVKNKCPQDFATGTWSTTVGSKSYTVANDSRIRCANQIAVEPSTIYSLSIYINDTLQLANYRVQAVGADGLVKAVSNSNMIQTTADTQYLTWYLEQDYTLSEVSIKAQLEEGTVATEFEPYCEPKTVEIKLSEPLRKIGNNVDYIDFSKKQVIRNTVSYTFTGNENWTTSGGYKQCFAIDAHIGADIQTGLGFIGNYRIVGSKSELTDYAIYPEYSGEVSTLYTTTATDVTALTGQSACFARVESITETVDLPELPVYEGTTTYTIEGLEPNNMYGKIYI